jgi:hypothetical protein
MNRKCIENIQGDDGLFDTIRLVYKIHSPKRRHFIQLSNTSIIQYPFEQDVFHVKTH